MREKLTEQFPILQEMVFGNSLADYCMSALIFVVSVGVLIILEKIVLSQIKTFSKKTESTLDDFVIHLVDKRILPVLYVLAFYFSTRQLALSENVAGFIGVATIVILVFQITRLASAILLKFLERHSEIRASRGESTATKTMGTVIRMVLWCIAVVFLLDNLGFNVSAVLAGLGIGGVAIALAAQNILGDLFNYFVIFFDKPFREGDFIIVGDYMGVIEHIGIKSTRVRSLGGEQLVFSNSDLTTTRLKNYKRMRERRVLFTLGVVYQTSVEKMKKISGMIKDIIGGVKDTRFDRAHFQSFGNFSLNIEIVYYVLKADYNKYMDIQEKINLLIQEKFESEGIEFAYPTQTLFMEKTGASPQTPVAH